MKKYKEILLKNLQSSSQKDIYKVDICNSLDCKNKHSNLDLFIPIAMYAQLLGDSDSVEFIKKKSKEFSFNCLLSEDIKYPNDLDDTCFGLQALFLNNEEIDERYILKLLELESQPGGPYYTWYVKDEKWLDIDPSVNANLLYTLALLGIELPKTLEYIKKCFQKNELKSKYYPTELITIYYLSKYVHKSGNEEILKNISFAYIGESVDKDFMKIVKDSLDSVQNAKSEFASVERICDYLK